MGIQFKGRGKILTADSRSYDFVDKEGQRRNGTSHVVRVNVEGEIYPIKTTEEQVKALQPAVGKEVDVVIEAVSPKERTSLKLVDVSEV